jgi:hypothetical protein
VEGGQIERPIRPAAGVRARQARRRTLPSSELLAGRGEKREAKAEGRGEGVVQIEPELENPQHRSDA